MFKNQSEHEGAPTRRYHESTKGKGPLFKKRMRIKKCGGKWKVYTLYLDRKKRRCYPRGKAWIRVIDLQSID